MKKALILIVFLLFLFSFLFHEGCFTLYNVYHPFASPSFYRNAVIYRYQDQTIFAECRRLENHRYTLISNPDYLYDEKNNRYLGVLNGNFDECNQYKETVPITQIYPELMSVECGASYDRVLLTDEEFNFVLNQYITNQKYVYYSSRLPWIGIKRVTPLISFERAQIYLVDFTDHPDQPVITKIK